MKCGSCALLRFSFDVLHIIGQLCILPKYLTAQQSHFKAIRMQITAWYIIPGEDTNKQFFLSCFQVGESSLYFALILCCLWFSNSAVSPFTLFNRCCPCLQRPRSFFSACLERQRVLFCQLQFPRGANHVVLHGQDFFAGEPNR